MSKVQTVCPHCRESSVLAKSYIDRFGLQNIPCPHCMKNLGGGLNASGSFDGLAKSAPVPSSELAELRVQVNAQFAELLSKLKGLTERRAAAPRSVSFQPQGQEPATVLKFVAGMPGGVMLEADVVESAELSRQQTAFVTKTASEDVSRAALEKALANGRPVTSSNYTRIGDGLEKDAQSTAIVERTAPAPTTRRSFQPLE